MKQPNLEETVYKKLVSADKEKKSKLFTREKLIGKDKKSNVSSSFQPTKDRSLNYSKECESSVSIDSNNLKRYF